MVSIYLLTKLKRLSQTNEKKILLIIEEFTTKKLSSEQLKSLIFKIDFYTNFYPTKFFERFSELEINLEKSLNSFNLDTSSISREQSECLFCKISLKNSKKINHRANIFYASRPSSICSSISTKCLSCGTEYFYSYFIKNNPKFFFKYFDSRQYVQFTTKTILERKNYMIC